jgi:hypothetical protein
MVMNSTDGTILWSALDPAPSLTEDVRTTDAKLAGAQAVTILDIPAGAFDTNPAHNDFTALGDQKLDQFGPGLDPTSLTPPAGVSKFITLSIFSHSFATLYAFTLAKLAFLQLPVLNSTVVDPAVIKYGGSLADGDVTGPGSPPAGLGSAGVLATFFSDGRSFRSAVLSLFALQFLPHRTKDGGDLLLYAVLRTQNSAGGQISRQYGLWRVSVDDGSAKTVVPWTTNVNVSTTLSNMVILGASLKHVLWKFNAGGQITIALTDTTLGVTKTLVQVPTGSGPDTAFLARNWEVLRPDLLYLLDDADKAVTNQFLKAWSSTDVTLDIARLVVDRSLTDAAKLKALGTVVPAGNIDFLSNALVQPMHVINPSVIPGQPRDA